MQTRDFTAMLIAKKGIFGTSMIQRDIDPIIGC